MSGPATVPLSLLTFWVSNKAYKILWGVLASLCAIATIFIVWLNERRRYEKEAHLRKKLTNSKQMKDEWEKLERKCQEYGGGSNLNIEAVWQRTKSTGKLIWFLMSGWDEGSRQRFQVVLGEAGNLLLASEYFRSHYPQYIVEPDPVGRWISTLGRELNEPLKVTGIGYTPTDGHSENGAIQELPRKSALLCAHLAAQEKWPRSKEDTA